jgi:hypothetical protein
MITKFDIFENIKARRAKYKRGDIVLVNSKLNKIENELMKITLIHEPIQLKNEFISYSAELLSDPEAPEDYIIFESEIIKKLESHSHIDAN